MRLKAEVAGLPFEDAPRNSYPGGQCGLDTGAGQVDMQADFTTPMNENEDEVELPFGVLSNPTFDPLFSCQLYLYGHSLGAQRDEPIVEDTSPAFAADSAMEDGGFASSSVYGDD